MFDIVSLELSIHRKIQHNYKAIITYRFKFSFYAERLTRAFSKCTYSAMIMYLTEP